MAVTGLPYFSGHAGRDQGTKTKFISATGDQTLVFSGPQNLFSLNFRNLQQIFRNLQYIEKFTANFQKFIEIYRKNKNSTEIYSKNSKFQKFIGIYGKITLIFRNLQ